MDMAPDFGSGNCRFEPCRARQKGKQVHSRRLKCLFDSFGHRLLRSAWRGDLLMGRGHFELDTLRKAAREGYFTVKPPDASHVAAMAPGSDVYDRFSFYRLTAKGWFEGIAIGASFEPPEARTVVAGGCC